MQGRPTDGNQASQQLTLHAGDIVQLDQAGVDGRPPCATGSVAFEARYTPRFFGMGQISGGARGGGARVVEPRVMSLWLRARPVVRG